jgi:hypothetical protein
MVAALARQCKSGLALHLLRSNQGSVWDTLRESLPQIPASPEKARFGKIANVV